MLHLIIIWATLLISTKLIYAQPCKNITDLLVTSNIIGNKEYISISFTADSITDPNMVKNLLQMPHPNPICITIPQNITYKGMNISTGITDNIYIINSHTEYIQRVLASPTMIASTANLRSDSFATKCKSDYINQQVSLWNVSTKDISIRSFNGIDGTVYRNPSAFGVGLMIVLGDPLSVNGAMCNMVNINGINTFRLLSDEYSYSTEILLKYKNLSYSKVWNSTSPNLKLELFEKISILPTNGGINAFTKWTAVTKEGGLVDDVITAPPGECLSLDKAGWLRGVTKTDIEGCLIYRLPSMKNILKKADGTYFDNTVDFRESDIYGARFPTFSYDRISYEYDDINGIYSDLKADYRFNFTLLPIEIYIPTNAPSSTGMNNRDFSNNGTSNNNTQVNGAHIIFPVSYGLTCFLVFVLGYLF